MRHFFLFFPVKVCLGHALHPFGDYRWLETQNVARGTAAEVRELKSAARKKTPAGKIAKALKRTEGATRQKAFSLGLSLDTRA